MWRHTNPIVYYFFFFFFFLRIKYYSKIRIAKHITKKKKVKYAHYFFQIKNQVLMHFQKVNMKEILDQ